MNGGKKNCAAKKRRVKRTRLICQIANLNLEKIFLFFHFGQFKRKGGKDLK